jgi:hypothetical protein
VITAKDGRCEHEGERRCSQPSRESALYKAAEEPFFGWRVEHDVVGALEHQVATVGYEQAMTAARKVGGECHRDEKPGQAQRDGHEDVAQRMGEGQPEVAQRRLRDPAEEQWYQGEWNQADEQVKAHPAPAVGDRGAHDSKVGHALSPGPHRALPRNGGGNCKHV